jgi:DNA-binding MltR family transcriptional regulator
MAKKLKKLDEGKVTDWLSFLDEFRLESDRATAIIGAAFLDNHLRLLLSQFFVDNPKVVNELLGGGEGDAPLSSFGPRITTAYALGLLGVDELHDLRIIKNLRNVFAHGLQGLSFSQPDIEVECSKLKAFEVLHGIKPELAIRSARDRYILSVELLANQIAFKNNDVMKERRSVPSEYSIALLFSTGLE